MDAAERSAKSQILGIIQDLPDDSTYDEILRELAFYRLVGRGLVDLERRKTVDTTTLRRRAKRWRL